MWHWYFYCFKLYLFISFHSIPFRSVRSFDFSSFVHNLHTTTLFKHVYVHKLPCIKFVLEFIFVSVSISCISCIHKKNSHFIFLGFFCLNVSSAVLFRCVENNQAIKYSCKRISLAWTAYDVMYYIVTMSAETVATLKEKGALQEIFSVIWQYFHLIA